MSAEIEVPGHAAGEPLSQPALMPVTELTPIAGASACRLPEGVQP